MAAGLSIDQAIRWARDFAAREWRLLLPLALAFLVLPAFAFQLAVPAEGGAVFDLIRRNDPSVRPLVILSAPLLVLNLFGLVAIPALALTPSISVGEAIGRAARRFPAVLLAGLACFAVVFGLMMLAGVVLAVVAVASGSLAVAQPLAIPVVLVPLTIAAARLMPFLALMADRPLGPVAGLKASWRLTRGRLGRLLGFALLFFVGSQIVSFAISMAAGSLILLAGKALGVASTALVLVALLAALVQAAVNVAYSLITTGIYRQIVGARNGI